MADNGRDGKIGKDTKNDLKDGMEYWSKNIHSMLATKFGANRLGHLLVVFPFGEATECSYISDTDGLGLAMLLRHLADKIEHPNSKIIRTH